MALKSKYYASEVCFAVSSILVFVVSITMGPKSEYYRSELSLLPVRSACRVHYKISLHPSSTAF